MSLHKTHIRIASQNSCGKLALPAPIHKTGSWYFDENIGTKNYYVVSMCSIVCAKYCTISLLSNLVQSRFVPRLPPRVSILQLSDTFLFLFSSFLAVDKLMSCGSMVKMFMPLNEFNVWMRKTAGKDG